MAVIRMSLDDSQFTRRSTSQSPNPTVMNEFRMSPLSSRSRQMQKTPRKFPKKLAVLIGIICLVSVLFLFGRNLVKRISPSSGGISTFIPVLKPKLAKDSEGKTNIMLVGIDTREGGGIGTQTELNTDTIILSSYDEVTNRLSMISFPRDLAVSYPGRTDLVRINSIYAIGEKNKKGSGLEKLQEVVEQISGKEIQYYAMVDLKGFIDAIDIVGGIDIYVENDLSGLYPLENFLYTRVSFKRGWNHMDGKTALQYSRVRKDVIPVSEGSDFGRAKRQQKVIQAVIDKASKSETLLDPKRLIELVGVTSKNLKTSKVTLEDLQAGVNIMKESGKPTSFSYVLDLYAGGDLRKLITEISVNPYMLGPKLGANKWEDIGKFIKLYMQEPMIVTMKKSIVIYSDGTPEKTQIANSFKKQYYFGKIEVTSKNSPGITTKGFVYALGGKMYEETAKFVATQLGLEYKAELPEEISKMDSKEFAIVAVY